MMIPVYKLWLPAFMDYMDLTVLCPRKPVKLNSSIPSAAFVCQWTGSSLGQVMACRLFGTKPLPEPVLAYCQLDSWEHITVKFESEFYHFHPRKCNWKCCLPKWQPFCPQGDELITHSPTGTNTKAAIPYKSYFKCIFTKPRSIIYTFPRPRSIIYTFPRPRSIIYTFLKPKSTIYTFTRPRPIIYTFPRPRSIIYKLPDFHPQSLDTYPLATHSLILIPIP